MDELLEWRSEFPALNDCVYMVSHSMGCMPQKAKEDVMECLSLWETHGADCWDHWLPEVANAGNRIAKLLSAPDNTVSMHQNCSTAMSVVASCLTYTPNRNKIVYTDMQFPTISYVWKAEERRGAKCVVVPTDDNIVVDTQRVVDAIDEQTIAVPISHALFRSSYLQDVKAISDKARSVGAHVILDTYQTLGVMPIDIVDLGVSFACGGSHKWLCGAAGAAYLYVRPDLHSTFEPRITGWFANESPFAFTMPGQTYSTDGFRYQNGTMAVTSYYQARAGQEIVGKIGATKIREKSQRQSAKIVERVLEGDYKLNSPKDATKRAGDLLGKRVLITGCGPIGVLCVITARLAGAAEIIATDLADNAIALAKQCGADRGINVATQPDALSQYEKNKGYFDVMFECSGSEQALAGGIAVLKPRSVLMQLGLGGDMTLPLMQLTAKEIDLRGSFRFHTEFAVAVGLMSSALVDVKPLISHTFDLVNAEKAFQIANDRTIAMKTQINFTI